LIRRDGEESAFGFTKVDREKLYGKKRRVVVDEQDRECSAAWLTGDGTALIMTGGTAHVWVDEHWASAEQDERVAVDDAGKVLELCPSTLGVPQDGHIVSPSRVLDHEISAVYQLTPESLGSHLAAELEEGKIIELPFRYREGLEHDTMFVLKNDEGVFALIGRDSAFGFLERTVLPESIEAGSEEEDELLGDLDFSMM
jgi:hypothetical protein